MTRSALSTFVCTICFILKAHRREELIAPVVQIKKLRPTKVNNLHHAATKRPSWHLNHVVWLHSPPGGVHAGDAAGTWSGLSPSPTLSYTPARSLAFNYYTMLLVRWATLLLNEGDEI